MTTLRSLLLDVPPASPEDLGEARRKLTLFLAEYWGGPARYFETYGHPRLRMRHASFAIGPEARERWLVHMRASLEASDAPPAVAKAMRQYFEAKRQYRDAIVFFRMGDFYEMFYEDALTAARALELVADGATLVDVRESHEWKSGHAPRAVHIPLGQIDQGARRLQKSRPVVVVCASGMRSRTAAGQLRSLGYEATSVSGGMAAWQRAGGEVRR